MSPHYSLARRVTVVISLAFTSCLVVLNLAGLPRVEAHLARETASTTGAGFLYRFDAMSQSFLTIPLSSGAQPIGVAVTGTHPTHVWVAEYGLDQITHVIFTDTSDYLRMVYPITSTADSGPYRIVVNGNEVWFTERNANRVGRLNAVTGHLDEFYDHGLSANAGLSDIKVAPDGAVWIGGQTVQRLIKLTVSSPSVYAFTEYTDTARPGFTVAPAFLAIDEINRIWITVPDAASYKIAQFTPSTQAFVWPALPLGSRPEGIVAIASYAWCADRSRNTIDQVQYETFPRVNSFGPITRPMDIAASSPSEFWLTTDDRQGAIAQFVYTSVVSYHISSFALPVARLQLTGIDVAPDNGVWVAAYTPLRVYLPLVLHNP